MKHERESISMSIEVSDDNSTGKTSFVSNLSTDERNDELDEIIMEHYKIKYESPARLGGSSNMDPNRVSSYFSNNNSEEVLCETRQSVDIGNRLYRAAKNKEKQRAMEVRAKVDQENRPGTLKLNLAAERSYTPMRARPDAENVHDHLYSLSRRKHIEKEKKMEEQMETIESQLRGAMISPEQTEKVVGRLYRRSKNKQEEGKKLRKEIEKKLAPRAQTPTKKIPLSKAGDMYERALVQKAQKAQKIEEILNAPRESTFPKMRRQSRSRSSSRRRSSSRARSQTPSRRDSARAITPIRGKANENKNRYEDSFQFRATRNKLPPVAIKTREQSPDLRS